MAQQKICSKCKVPKSVVDFHKDRAKSDGLSGTCKLCAKERVSSWYFENKDKVLASRRGSYSRNNHYMTRYGITLLDYQELESRFDGKCHNTGCTELASEQRYGRLVVDHCHDSDVVRGALCQGCNKSLGLLKENTDRMEGLIMYVNSYALGVDSD